MCGIFGVIGREHYGRSNLLSVFEKVGELSESRGSESSGLAIRFQPNYSINILKGPVPISDLIDSFEYKKLKEEILNNGSDNDTFIAIGHARLVTSGSQLTPQNNQPVIKNNIIGVHNGIIVNTDNIWKANPKIKQEYEIDTEALLSLIDSYIKQSKSTVSAVCEALKDIYGTVASAFIFKDRNELILTTNNGSLYIATNDEDFIVFASEHHILKSLIKKQRFLKKINLKIEQVKSGGIYQIIFPDILLKRFANSDVIEREKNNLVHKIKYAINITNIKSKTNQRETLVDSSIIILNKNATEEQDLLEYNVDKINSLKRCTKCVLPETFPFIRYDSKGECNICNNYKKKNQPNKSESLIELVKSYRKTNDEAECLVPFSGGRDSSYTLHYIVNELKLKPITFTYDWGMVTDLARRNIARLCGKLGVENIIVSANIRKKRSNIQKNVAAWLKKPELGMIPLFMAGDKLFFYYFNKLMRETNTKLCFSGSNSLENTDFKVGFSGIDINFDKKAIDSLRMFDKLILFKYITKNIMLNPSYINSSVFDSLKSFYSRYFLSRKNLIFFFGYVDWDEKNIENTLINEYDWEFSPETNSSWRIGDGTVGFYNYIYYTVAGFSEIETFRSNQIREGLISREEAINLIYAENKPMYRSIKWYLEAIGLDFTETIKKINNIKKCYKI